MSELYNQSEWQTREQFVRLIEAVCAERGIGVTWLSDYWVGIFEKSGRTFRVDGYIFPLNDAAAAGIMRDKTATFALMARYGIPAISHFLVRLQPLHDINAAIKLAMQQSALPLVLKPNAGWSSGVDVFKCATHAEVSATIKELASRHMTIAVSPFVDIKAEYRVLLLDNEPQVVFDKIRQNGAWHHNLKRGAVPRVVTDQALRDKLVAIAKEALDVTGGRLAAVDIVDTPTGYQIMEINCGITLSAFSQHSPQNAELARGIYANIIDKCLGQ